MEVIEYNDSYIDDVKDLLCELQEYIVKLDKYHIQTMNDDYKDKYYLNMMRLVNDNKGKIYIALEDNKVLGFIVGIVESKDTIEQLKKEKERLISNLEENVSMSR